MATDWVDEVIAFWFEELTPDDWYERKDATDETIRNRFGDLHARLRARMPAEAMSDPRAALAAVIVFDQFSRNMFRGTADAFASDELALTVARNAVDKRLTDALTEPQRQFVYMPFMHSEVVADQERSVMLFKTLETIDVNKYADEHRDIVARFGRFPHRNRVLGRASTEDEKAFLEGHAGFGQ